MNRFVTLAAVTAISATLVACSGGAPTSPSSLGSSTPSAQFPVVGEGSGNGGRISALAIPIAVTPADVNFIVFAATAHQAQIQIAMVAEGRVAHPLAKHFAQQMKQENTEALQRLRELSPSSVPQSIALTGAQQAILSDVSAATGNPADRVYTQATETELTALLAAYQQAANASGSDPDLRAHASDVAGKLTRYLDILREIVARVR